MAWYQKNIRLPKKRQELNLTGTRLLPADYAAAGEGDKGDKAFSRPLAFAHSGSQGTQGKAAA